MVDEHDLSHPRLVENDNPQNTGIQSNSHVLHFKITDHVTTTLFSRSERHYSALDFRDTSRKFSSI